MTTPLAAPRRRGAALLAVTTLAAVVLTVGSPAGAAIVPTIKLGTGVNYPVLGHSTVTNTNPTVIGGGNVGLSPGSSITGFLPLGPGVITAGFAEAATANTLQAQVDVGKAYTKARNRGVTATLAVDLGNTPGNLPLQGGVYDTIGHGALGLTGTLVLDGGGNKNTVFIFQSGSTLTTASNSVVRLINGAQECNVFWQLDSSATLGTDSVFVGNILAHDSVTVTSRVAVHGRAFALNGAVTLDDNVFSAPTCAQNTSTSAPAGGGTTTTAAGGTATTLPGGGTATTVPGGGTPTLPGTPPGGPGVPPVAGPPHTGGGPLPGAGFPWFAVLFAGLFATAALGGTLRAHRIRARSLATRLISSGPSRR